MANKVAKTPKVQPWHKLEDESFNSYNLFRAYLEMGSERTLSKVAEETKRSTGLLGQLSAKFNWVKRAGQYDAHLLVVEEKAVIRAVQQDAIVFANRRRQYIETEYQVAGDLMQRARQMLSGPLYETTIDKVEMINGQEVATHITLKPAGWNQATGLKALKLSTELMRLALQMETKRVANVTVEDPNVRLEKAKAAIEGMRAEANTWIDEELALDPTLDRAQLLADFEANLPQWTAEHWRLTPDQTALLLTGDVKPITMTTGEDYLPFPEAVPVNDLEN